MVLIFNAFLTITGKFPVTIGTLLYVFGSCERHSKLTEQMHVPLRPIPKEDTLRCRRFCKLGKSKKLEDPSIGYMECNSAEVTSSGKC